LRDGRITREGVVVLKGAAVAQPGANKADALRRLQELVDSVAVLPTVRRATKPTLGSQRRRLKARPRTASANSCAAKSHSDQLVRAQRQQSDEEAAAEYVRPHALAQPLPSCMPMTAGSAPAANCRPPLRAIRRVPPA
jgi:hypothetical protein